MLPRTSLDYEAMSGYAVREVKATSRDSKSGKHCYHVTIETGEQQDAGSSDQDSDIYIKLIGSAGKTEKVYINSCLQSLFSAIVTDSKTDEFWVETESSLGDILVVEIGNEQDWFPDLRYSPWFVDSIEVDSKLFPCYHWIGDGDYVSVTAKTTTRKEVGDNEILTYQREEQLTMRRSQYEWQTYPDLGYPSSIEVATRKLPADEKFSRVKGIDFTMEGAKALLTLGFQNITGATVDTLEGFKQLAEALGDPEAPVYNAARWTTDVEFGRQMLNGVNPVVVQKCTSIPSKFAVTNDLVKPFLNRGLTLEQEMQAGHVYLCDLSIMDGLASKEGSYTPAPLCLLYVNGSSQLVPIAIQLQQQPGEDNPVYLPSDNWIDWLLAKIYYQSVHNQFHQLATHYFSCHAAMEAYGMAVMRNLPDPHPIFKLLRPHFRYTMAINSRARDTLINRGGIIDQIFSIGGDGKEEFVRRGSKAYSVHWTNIKRSVKRRQTDDKDQLPGYYYRDDGFQVWDALEKYTTDVIDAFYECDDDVKNDIELKNWANEIHTIGFPGYFGGEGGHGFPQQITTKAELVEYCTLIMFTGSAQHASINFGQYEMYGFVPNAPTTTRLPPSKKGEATFQTLLETLPDNRTTVLEITTVYSLSQYSPEETFLGTFHKRFTERQVQSSITELQGNLENISEGIKARNEALDVPYTYMLPEGIPNSITI